MLEYAAIVPHSPLLSTRITKKDALPPKTRESFDAIADNLISKNIKHIITIGSHSKFNRHFFSAYISDNYLLTFPEFGDLVTNIEVKSWWQGFHKLRESLNSPPLEVLSHKELDHTHGIPLMHLTSRFSGPDQLSVLAINDAHDLSDEDRLKFGAQIRIALDSLDIPYAVICSGDLFVTTEQTNSKAIHQENKTIKLAIEKDLSFKEDSGLAEITAVKHPTLSNTLPILKGILGETIPEINEISFETINQTSLYFADINLKA